ncbi:MAG: FtsW/RodA/SpoVE family cell cycle protein [Phycisphaerales bacterium JB039]
MLRCGHFVALCALCLLLLGVVMVTSAGLEVEPIPKADPVTVLEQSPRFVVSPAPPVRDVEPLDAFRDVALSRPAAYMALATLAMTLTSLLPIRRIGAALDPPADGRGGLVVLAAGTGAMLVVLGLVYLPGVGRAWNGSARWIGVGGLSVQPSELAKWGMVGLMGWYGAARAAALPRFGRGLMPALVALGIVSGFVVLEDLGTGVLIGGVGAFVLLAAGARIWHFAVWAAPAAAGVALAIMTSEYRMRRITAFLDPWADPKQSGYHMLQSMAAIAGGEGPGRGLGHGLQKYGYLPEDTNDFLFAIICEELGIAGAALVVGLFAGLLWASVSIIRREQSPALRLIGLGVIATVSLQAVMNLVVVTGLGPTKGIALPMVSAGGTGWCLTAACLGLLIAMDRAQRRDEQAGAEEEVAEWQRGQVAKWGSAAAAS